MSLKSLAKSIKSASKAAGKTLARESVGFGARFIKGALSELFSVDPSKKKGSNDNPSPTNPSSKSPKKANPSAPITSKTSPKKVKPIAAPSLTSIEDQMKEINRVLLKISKVLDKDVNARIEQAIKESRLERENTLEAANDNEPHAIREESTDKLQIEKLQGSFDEFIGALDEAIEKLSNLDFSQSSSGGILDLPSRKSKKGSKGSAGRKQTKLPKGISADDLIDKNGRELKGAARASRIEKLAKERGLVKGGFAGATKLAGKATKERIAKIAKPLLTKAGFKATAKSIPVLGAGLGLVFAASRLMDGDVVGAGLEAVSGIGSVATAIPATIMAISRDIYHETYGVQPEEDPQGKERLANIVSTVKEIATEEFVAQKKEDKTSKKAATATVRQFKPLSDNPWNKAWQDTANFKPNTTPVNKPAASAPSAAVASAPAQERSGGGGSSSSSSSHSESKSSPPPPQATPVVKESNDGAAIQSAAMKIEQIEAGPSNPIVDVPNIFPQQAPPSPNEIVSNPAGVPDPNYYNNLDLIDQLYFTAIV